MSEAATDLLTEREAIDQSLKTDPENALLHIKAAQLEAKIWVQDAESADLTKAVHHLDLALNTLPAERHAQVKAFAIQLQQRGANIAPIIKSGAYPRLLTVLTAQNGASAPAATPTPVPEPPAAEVRRPAPEPTPIPVSRGVEPKESTVNGKHRAGTPAEDKSDISSADTSSPYLTPMPGTAIQPGGVRFKEVPIGEVNNVSIRNWLQRGQVAELASAFPLIDNFRTRRVVADKIAEQKTPLAVCCLIHALAHEHDENAESYIRKKLRGYDLKMLVGELLYDVRDTKHKGAVVAMLAELRNEACVPGLKAALSDPDAGVRGKALTALSAVNKVDPSWLRYLGKIVLKDRDPRVRLEAAKILQGIDTMEAFLELETASKQTQFDTAIAHIHADMSKKFLKGRMQEIQAKRKKEEQEEAKLAAKRASAGEVNVKAWALLAFVFLALGGVAWYGYAEIKRRQDPFGVTQRLKAQGAAEAKAAGGAGGAKSGSRRTMTAEERAEMIQKIKEKRGSK